MDVVIRLETELSPILILELRCMVLLSTQVESNRKHNALKATLRRHDAVAQAERRRRNLVSTPSFDGCRCCYDPNSDGHAEYQALAEYKAQRPILESLPEVEEEEKKEIHDSDEDSDDEFDYLLDEDLPGDEFGGGSALKELEEQRRAELEFEMIQRQTAMQHGYGTHRQLHPGRVLKAAGLASNPARAPPPAVVLHLFDPDSTTSASLDYFLETDLAPRYPGTIFLRSGGRFTLLMDESIAQRAFGNRLQADRDMPALVAIRNGVAVNICPQLKALSAYDGEEVETRAVEMWLENSGVLLSNPPNFYDLCHIRPEEDALMDYLAHQKPEEVDEEEIYDCGVPGCQKTFHHEHVGVKTEQQDGLIVKEETILDEAS